MTTPTRRKRLIEVAFPLEEVSAHSRREKNVRHGHISTLHIWWARRPLAACRAFIYASLVDEPPTEAEREELLKEVADLASWDAVRHPERVVRAKADGGSGLTGTELLVRARLRILADNDGKPPKLLDPFAGGGSIPLEGLRLGCDVEASDLNPVAVLILKGTVEYPQKYGQPNSRPAPDYIREAANDPTQGRFNDGDLVDAYKRNPLSTDVRYWGKWILEKAREELAEFYPPDPDGSVPVAYLWSRTIPCPSCNADMPLIRQYWLARKEKRKVALEPVIDRENNRVDFKVVEGPNVTGNPAEATTSRGDSRCLLCGQVVKAEVIRTKGLEYQIGETLTAVVFTSSNTEGKRYRPDHSGDQQSFERARQKLKEIESDGSEGISVIPNEPIGHDPRKIALPLYGFATFDKLFNSRQLLTLSTLNQLVVGAHAEMQRRGLDSEYSKVITTYLAFVLCKAADFGSTLCILNNVGGRGVVHTFSRQALPMVWDYAESNPFCEHGAGWMSYLVRTAEALEQLGFGGSASTMQHDAKESRDNSYDFVITDPPYYDSINYADLSDFFYVWLKRSIGSMYPQLLDMPLTPKRDQVIMNVYGSNVISSGPARTDEARRAYVDGMSRSFGTMGKSLQPGGALGIVFAHTDPGAWSTLIEGLLNSGLIPESSWPIDTEREGKVSSLGQARLKTSVWMACRKREESPGEAFLGDVLVAMRPVVRERLLYFWSKGIRGADFFISAIGPALSVFGQYERVLRPDGTKVTVRDFLDIVRRESTTVALEQVLHGADLGVIDPVTRQFATWVWSYSKAPLDAGEAIALCLATGASYADTTRPESIAEEGREKSKKVVRLRTIRQRASEDEDLGFGTPARPAPLIDQLQYAAWLWGQNRAGDLGNYRGTLGESRWGALRTLGQAVAECLPEGDDDRRIINGLLGSSVMGMAPLTNGTNGAAQPAGAQLPGFEAENA